MTFSDDVTSSDDVPLSDDPRVDAYLREVRAAPPGPATLAAARQDMRDSTLDRSGPVEPVASVRDLVADGPALDDAALDHRAGPLRVRVYAPTSDPAPGVCVYLHGGAFVVGDVDVYDPVCRRLARRSGWVVASVDYRLAPEHPFPAAVEDADAALAWAADHLADLGAPAQGGRGGRLAVAGDSAGGALAAVAARHAAERGGPPLALQVLVYPVTDLASDSPSWARYGEGYDLDRDSYLHDLAGYLRDTDAGHPDASPLRAADLSGVAPALVVLAELDPLHDEGLAYAGRLRDAGVDVAVRDYAGQVHGFFRSTALFPRGHDAIAAVAEALRGVA